MLGLIPGFMHYLFHRQAGNASAQKIDFSIALQFYCSIFILSFFYFLAIVLNEKCLGDFSIKGIFVHGWDQ